MNFNSHYLWERGSRVQRNGVSLVLQHVQIRKKQVLLACVCESDPREEELYSGYFTERMVEWFHQRYLKLFFGEKALVGAIEDLQKEKELILREINSNGRKKGFVEKLHFCMILIKDEQFALLKSGNCKVYLLNKRFNRQQIKEWTVFDENDLCSGELQKNIGLILGTESFWKGVVKTGREEVLFLDRRADDLRIEKRLNELWQELKEHGEEQSAGVVYIKTS